VCTTKLATVVVHVDHPRLRGDGPGDLVHVLPGGQPGAEVEELADPRLADQVPHRSVHTLLANSYALERMTGIGFLAPSERLLRESPIPAWPDVIVYLDLPQDAVHERNNGKFPSGSIYIDAGFNAAIRAYSRRLAGRESPRVAWLDTTLDPAELARLTRALLRHRAAHRHIRGAV
jgi:hypothetical protein